MLSKKLAIALALGSAVLFSRASLAADSKKSKSAEPAAKAEGEAKPAAEKVAGDKAAGDKATGDKPAAASSIKLTKPWSDLTTLTEDQRAKIDAIHKKQLAETSVIDKKAKDDIMAVLTDAQKAELKELNSKKKKDTTAAKKTTEAAGEKKAEKSDAK